MSSYCFLDSRGSSCLQCPEMAAEVSEAHLSPAGMDSCKLIEVVIMIFYYVTSLNIVV